MSERYEVYPARRPIAVAPDLASASRRALEADYPDVPFYFIRDSETGAVWTVPVTREEQ